MKSRILSLALVLIAFTGTYRTLAQGMAVNTSGSTSDASAMLDVSATDKGMLVPRMTASQRTGISNPATGLLVYQTDGTSGFYYNSGTPSVPAWTSLSGGGSGTVTSVSSGNLSPLFTSSVSSATTLASISYSLSNASSYAVLTNSTNATATPGYGKVVPQALYAASGTPGPTTFYRGDGVWSAPASGGVQMFSAVFVSPTTASSYGHLNTSATSGTNGASADTRSTYMPFGGTITGIYVRGVYSAGSGTATFTIKLYKNGVATSMSVALGLSTLGTAYFGSNTSNSFTFNAGDYISIELVQSSTTPVANISVTTTYTQ